jgi:hypothetical protein
MLITTFQLLRSPFDPFLGVPSGWSPNRKLPQIWISPRQVLVLYLERPATQHCAAACSQRGRF